MADKRPWVKIDVGWHMNRKWFTVERILHHAMPDAMPDALLNALHQAMHAHLVSILYCGATRSDGIFPVAAIKQYGRITSEPAITALFDVGMWVNRPGGMAEIRDYLEHNPSANELETASEKARKAATARWNSDAKRNASSNASSNAEKRREEKRRESNYQSGSSHEEPGPTPRPDIQEILDYLDTHLHAAELKIPNRTKTNITAARLLLDTDGHTVDEIKRAIDWTFQDEFWRTNIRSASKLREKWGQLKGAAERNRHRQQGQPPLSRSDQLYIAEMQRLHAEEQAQSGQLAIEGSSL